MFRTAHRETSKAEGLYPWSSKDFLVCRYSGAIVSFDDEAESTYTTSQNPAWAVIVLQSSTQSAVSHSFRIQRICHNNDGFVTMGNTLRSIIDCWVFSTVLNFTTLEDCMLLPNNEDGETPTTASFLVEPTTTIAWAFEETFDGDPDSPVCMICYSMGATCVRPLTYPHLPLMLHTVHSPKHSYPGPWNTSSPIGAIPKSTLPKHTLPFPPITTHHVPDQIPP